LAEDTYRMDFGKTLKMLAPGTIFRLGIENVLQANTGGLIVVGDTPEVIQLTSGGFKVDCAFTPARLYELAKMDGAIITNHDVSRIIYANAQLDPDPALPTQETGIRHRTAERVALQTGELVVAISQRRRMVTLYKGSGSYRMRDIASTLVKANQALQTLEKYRNVLSRELQRLGGLEFEELVTLGEVCELLRRSIRVLNIGAEIEIYISELGVEGRLVRMQLIELIANVHEEATLIIKDYFNAKDKSPAEVLNAMLRDFEEENCDLIYLARILGLGSATSHLEQQVSPRGYRMLQKIPRIPPAIIDNLVQEFALLHNITRASIEQLDDVEGIGEVRARSIKNGLMRLREQLLLDYMV